jgi:protein phosphatase
MIQYTIHALTDVGRERETNEDSVLAEDLGGGAYLLAVADGMGGHAAGDVASETALDAFAASVRDQLDEGAEKGTEVLDEAVTAANSAVHDAASDGREGMGTTLVAALVEGGRALIANVGDSRCYHVDPNGEIEQVTTDQSLVQELVEQGAIEPEEAADHPQRNVVSQSLGTDETVDPDFESVRVGGALVLCSDGLNEEVDDPVIAEIVHEASDIEGAADSLVQRANENGGSDNISVVLGARWS